MASRGSLVYIGNGALFQVLDVTRVDSPKVIGELETPDLILDLVIKDDYAYVVPPLSVIDLSIPSAPQLVRSFSQSSIIGAQTLSLDSDPDSNYLYVGGYLQGAIVNIDDPHDPQIMSYFYPTGDFVESIAARGRYLYISTNDGFGLDYYDISRKDSPIELTQLHPFGRGPIAIQDSFLFSAWGVLSIYDISVPDTLPRMSWSPLRGTAHSITVHDSLVYIAMADSGFSEFDVSDKFDPREIRHIDWIGSKLIPFIGPIDQAIADSTAFIASSTGLWTVNLHSDTLKTLSFTTTGDEAGRMALDGNYLYLCSGEAGLQIFDVTDETRPRFIFSLTTDLPAIGIGLQGNTAILLEAMKTFTRPQRLVVLDIANPTRPEVLSAITFNDPTASQGWDHGSVVIKDSIVFSSFGTHTINIVNISDRMAPLSVKNLPTTSYPGLGGGVMGLALSGNFLYSAEDGSGLRVYDVSNPANPTQVDSITNIDFRGVLADGDKLFTSGNGLTIYDISSPDHPNLISNLATSNQYQVSISKSNSYIYLADGFSLTTIDVGDSKAPIVKSRLNLYWDTWGVVSQNDIVFMSNRWVGVKVFRNSFVDDVDEGKSPSLRIENFSLHQNYPNPFNSSTTLSYDLREQAYVRLVIYDTNGKEVREFIRLNQERGEHVITWDGRNEGGEDVSSGVYLVRLKTPRFDAASKIVLIR